MTNESTTTPASRSRFATQFNGTGKSLRRVSHLGIAVLFTGIVAGSVSIVVGCGWWGTERSVRFNDYTTEHRMSRLPPLDFVSGDDDPNGWRSDEELETTDYEAEQEASRQRTARARELWRQADDAERKGELHQARAHLREFLRAAEEVNPYDWTYPQRDATYTIGELQSARASALDRLDALTALDAGAPSMLVQAYLAARAGYDGRNDEARAPVEEVNDAAQDNPPIFSVTATKGAPPPPPPTPQNFLSIEEAALGVYASERLTAASTDRRLRDNCDYLRAAIRYRNRDYTDAALRFQQLADTRPSSEKRDAARFMAGLSWMKTSRSYAGADTSAVGAPACLDCQDEAWTRARDAFAALVRSRSTRFASEARGWLAYLYLRVGRTGDGLAEYYRLLACRDCKEMRPTALLSLRMARPLAQPADMERVKQLLTNEPEAALAYIYHNTYNYTFHTLFSWDEESDYLESIGHGSSQDWQERQRLVDKHRDSLQRAELARVARFAASLLHRHPHTRISSNFAVRLAGLNLELGEHRTALDLTERALRLGATGDFRAESLWVKGIAEDRLSKMAAARRTLQTLVDEYPRHRLTEGARRHLAMAAEDAGDLGAALEQYIRLDYIPDIAYFLDVLMSPEEIRLFIESHPQHERIDEIWYALGVRHLREGRWDAAREAYAHVRTAAQHVEDTTYSRWNPDAYRNRPFVKSQGYAEGRGVQAYWVLSDLKTIDALEGYERMYANAPDADTRAEALYQKASYLFEASTLLFYNPVAWRTSRYFSLSHLHETNSYRLPDEAARLLAYSERHEPVAQALAIYLQIVETYPHTRAARDALYTAAVCHERLSDYNQYWREIYDKRLHAGSRMVTYADVRRTYPRYQLPRATLSWEPATRTVNGGEPGWSPKPKPAPRLSKFERGRRKAWAVYDTATAHTAHIWQTYARPPLIALGNWLLIGFTLAGAFAARRAAGRTRALWRVESVNRESSALAMWSERGYRQHRKFRHRARRALGWRYLEVRDTLRLQFVASARFLAYRGRRTLPSLASRAWRTLCDRQARRLLALNVATHAALAVLLAMLWRLL